MATGSSTSSSPTLVSARLETSVVITGAARHRDDDGLGFGGELEHGIEAARFARGEVDCGKDSV